MSEGPQKTRGKEWYVPQFGPMKFRVLVGLTFYPYTLMNASYVLIGSLVAPSVHQDRMALMALVYLLAVGVSAHSLDALAPNKPWGTFLSRRSLLLLAVGGLTPALGLGLYLASAYAVILIPVGLLEVFFLLAYNLELFGGRLHNDWWFAFSWGLLPVLAGYAVQAGTITAVSLAAGTFGFSTAFIEINASRPYKALKADASTAESLVAKKLESILKGVVTAVLTTALFLYARLIFG